MSFPTMLYLQVGTPSYVLMFFSVLPHQLPFVQIHLMCIYVFIVYVPLDVTLNGQLHVPRSLIKEPLRK